MTPEAKRLQSRIAITTRWHPESPGLIETRREYKALTLEEHIRRVIDTAPELTDDQLTKLATLLRPGMGA